MTTRTRITLPPALKAWAVAYAAKNGLTLSQLIEGQLRTLQIVAAIRGRK